MACQHLAGDLGVDGVGVVQQRRREECEARVEDEPEDEEREAVAIEGREFDGHVVSVWACWVVVLPLDCCGGSGGGKCVWFLGSAAEAASLGMTPLDVCFVWNDTSRRALSGMTPFDVCFVWKTLLDVCFAWSDASRRVLS